MVNCQFFDEPNCRTKNLMDGINKTFSNQVKSEGGVWIQGKYSTYFVVYIILGHIILKCYNPEDIFALSFLRIYCKHFCIFISSLWCFNWKIIHVSSHFTTAYSQQHFITGLFTQIKNVFMEWRSGLSRVIHRTTSCYPYPKEVRGCIVK